MSEYEREQHAREEGSILAERDEAIAHLDTFRAVLRALVEAMDAQVAASLQGDDRTEADAAFARALSAARGVL